MLVLNFAHPFTDEQLTQIATLTAATPEVRFISTQVDRSRPIVEVALELVNAADLSSEEWQTWPLLINPPGLAPLALALVAEIHGRSGYFVPILNMCPIPDVVPPRFTVAEIVNLHALREAARQRRSG